MGSPTLSSQPKGYHARMDDNDNNMHYPKGFITADDNTFIVKGNDSELAYQVVQQLKKVKVTSAELKAIATTPKTLIEAPGTGRVIIPALAMFWYDYGTTDYTITDDLILKHDGGNDQYKILSSDIASSADVIKWSVSTTNPHTENVPLILTSASNPTDGDGDLYLWVRYYILEQW